MPEEARAAEVLRTYRGCTDSLIGNRRGLLVRAKDDRAFLRAMREAFAHHYLACPEYRQVCQRQGLLPSKFRRLEQLPEIPYLFVTVLKYNRLISVPESRIRLVLTSSGTGGQKSAIYLDGKSLQRIERIVSHIYADLGMVNRRRTNYLCFTYDPEVAQDLGTAFSDKLLTNLTRVAETFYCIRWDGQDWFVDRQGVLAKLERFQASGRPLRVLGFPAHAWDVLGKLVERRGRPFVFGPLSYVITGGGWKTLAGHEIPKPEFRARLGEWLGIPPANVRDLYGMVEHGVPYCECEFGRMHVPRYSRVFVREPESLRVLDWGETGILHFLTPYLHSFPAISLLTTDVGHLEPDCPCGRRSPVLVLQGRGGVTKHKGCAMAALEVLKS
ncbi:MAG: acyl-protein synthetase [Candidatus Eremiobacteraeota bacterium]|nr:acyl-protein synthetase [Candidatus Eremiobacteraeota bacterium]